MSLTIQFHNSEDHETRLNHRLSPPHRRNTWLAMRSSRSGSQVMVLDKIATMVSSKDEDGAAVGTGAAPHETRNVVNNLKYTLDLPI